jgi:hypothetical protein
MRDSSTPRHRREADAPALVTSTEAALIEAAHPGAEYVQPAGYDPRCITEPPSSLEEAAQEVRPRPGTF